MPPTEPPRRAIFDLSFFVFVAAAAVSGAAVLLLKGPDVFLAALGGDVRLLLRIAPLIAAGLLVGGFMQVLLPSDLVARWLGQNSGLRGLSIATAAGVLTPGGPFVSFPLVLALAAAGADIGALVAYITSWSVLGVTRIIMWEVPFMGFDFAATRWVASLLLPFIAGLLARQLQIRIDASRAGDGAGKAAE